MRRIRFGPLECGFSDQGQLITRTLTETSHILQICIDPAATKAESNARLVRPGRLAIEWPRSRSEDISVE